MATRLCIRITTPYRIRSDLFPIRSDAFRSGLATLAFRWQITARPRLLIRTRGRTRGGPFYECYTPVPLTYHAGWLPKVKKAVPVSDRVLRSHVAKHTFRGLTVTPLNGLDFD